jgi:hypothetical protein
MTTLLSKLIPSTLTLALGLAAAGCDQNDAEDPTDRAAQVVMERDGKPVRTWNVAEVAEMQADLVIMGALAPSSDACEAGEVELGLVLEQDGEELASFEGCAAAEPGGHVQPADALTAAPDVQGTFWCNVCADSDDCYACCRCAGGAATICAHQCIPE